MKKKVVELILAASGIGIFVLAVYYASKETDVPDQLKVIGFAVGGLFFVYKLFTGWLFINLTVKMEAERQRSSNEKDHLTIKLTLSKGNIDSLWLEDVEIRISCVLNNDITTSFIDKTIIKPIGLKNSDREIPENTNNGSSWEFDKTKKYVLSPDEEVTYSAYTTVATNEVIAAEVLIIGSRPFYGIESNLRKPILWKSSIIILPCKNSGIKDTKPPQT